jgi:hypothetical protein
MSDLNNSALEGSINRLRDKLIELTEVKKLMVSRIAVYLGIQKHQRSYFYKFINGDPLPKYLEPTIGKILEQLNQLDRNPDLLNVQLPEAKDDIKGYDLSKPFLVWVPFNLELPITDDYNLSLPPLSIYLMGKQKGILLYRNTSKYNADGELFVGQTGMASNIEPATRIAIKRINKAYWKTDRYYVIIDASEEISICELLPGDDKKTVKFVSSRNSEGPHKEFPLKDILAIFSIVDGNWTPTPPRNRIAASTYQHQDQPPIDSTEPSLATSSTPLQ